MKISTTFMSTFLLLPCVWAEPVSKDITVPDPSRDLPIECRVYYPKEGQNLPVILFSHGFGGDKTAFATASSFLSGEGFVIIHPSHRDGFGRAQPAAVASGAGNFRDSLGGRGLSGLLNDPVKTEGRVADLVAILDGMDQVLEQIPELTGRVDSTRIGVGGHSFGAYTSMLIGGVTVDLGPEEGRSFTDSRVRAILPISAQGAGQQGLTESSWEKLMLPLLTITGSRDRGAGGQGPDWKKEPYFRSPPGDKFLVDIEGANHFSFGGGRGGRTSNVSEIVNLVSLAFWNAYLKGDEAARASLHSGDVLKEYADVAEIQSK